MEKSERQWDSHRLSWSTTCFQNRATHAALAESDPETLARITWSSAPGSCSIALPPPKHEPQQLAAPSRKLNSTLTPSFDGMEFSALPQIEEPSAKQSKARRWWWCQTQHLPERQATERMILVNVFHLHHDGYRCHSSGTDGLVGFIR